MIMQDFETETCNSIENIWSSMLGLPVARKNGPFQNGDDETYTGYVTISGAWEGTVSILCPKTLAQKVAAIMYEVDENDATREQIEDTLGELANMAGGNIKNILPGNCALSLPTVDFGEHPTSTTDAETVSEVVFNCRGLNFSVNIVKHLEKS